MLEACVAALVTKQCDEVFWLENECMAMERGIGLGN